MNIVVVNGNMRHGSTWHCVQAVLAELEQQSSVEITEYNLPKDLPEFCVGCYSCFYKGETACPHAQYVQPIAEAIAQSDVVVLSSPVYGMDVSGQMKAFLDHLCYMWMSHRPNPAMFNKIGLVVVTTAGAGLGHTAKTMKNSLKFWGVKRIFSFKSPVSAMKWDEVSEKRKLKITKDAKALASRIGRAADRVDRLRNPLFRSVFFKMMTGMQKGNDWNPTDRSHWERQGWLSGEKPF